MYAESAYSLFKELNETLEIAQKVKKSENMCCGN